MNRKYAWALASALTFFQVVLPSQNRVGFALFRSDRWVEGILWSCLSTTEAPPDAAGLGMQHLPEQICLALVHNSAALCAAAVSVTMMILLAALPASASVRWTVLVCLNPLSLFLPLFRSGSSFFQLLLGIVLLSATKWSALSWSSSVARLLLVSVVTFMLGWRSFFAIISTELEGLAHRKLRLTLGGRALLCAIVTAMFATALVLQGSAPIASGSTYPSMGSRWYLEQQLMRIAGPGFSWVLSLYPVVVTQLLCLRLRSEAKNLRALQQLLALAVSYFLSCENTASDTVFLAVAGSVVLPSVMAHALGGFLPFAILILCLPLMQVYYIGWVRFDVANANWLFFTCVAFSVACSLVVVEAVRFALKSQPADEDRWKHQE
jgi:hypothetical protein